MSDLTKEELEAWQNHLDKWRKDGVLPQPKMIYKAGLNDGRIELQKRIDAIEAKEYGAKFIIKRLIEDYDSLPINAQSEFPGMDIDDARSFISEGGGGFCEWKHQDRRRHLYSTSCGMKNVLRPYPNNIGKLVHDYCGKPIRISKGGGE